MEFTTSLLIESWILYILGVATVLCRLTSRRIKLGKWRNLMIDDYLMLFALVRLHCLLYSCLQDLAIQIKLRPDNGVSHGNIMVVQIGSPPFSLCCFHITQPGLTPVLW